MRHFEYLVTHLQRLLRRQMLQPVITDSQWLCGYVDFESSRSIGVWIRWYRFTLDKNYHTPFHSWYSLHYILIYFAGSIYFFKSFWTTTKHPDDLTSSMGFHTWFTSLSADSTNVTRKFGSGSKDHVEVFLRAEKTNKTTEPGCSWLSRVWIPSRELTYPTKREKENHLQKCLSMGDM